MKSDKKGKSNKKPAGSFNWSKAVLIMVGILFVGVMIITSLGMNWLVTMNPAKSGDVAYVDVSLKDALGRTVLTTNQRIFNASLEQGNIVLLTSPMSITVNSSVDNFVESIPAYTPSGGQVQFAFLGPEFNQISSGLVGMKEGETRHIQFETNPYYFWNINEEQFGESQPGENFTEVRIGDQMVFGVTTTPMLNTENNTTPLYALRTVAVSNKTAENMSVSFGYSGAEVTILRLSRSS